MFRSLSLTRVPFYFADRPMVSRGDVRPIPGGWIATALIASGLALAVLLAWAGLSVNLTAVDCLPLYICGAIAIGLRTGLHRPRSATARVLRDTAEYYAVFTVIGVIGAVASYPIAGLSHGFADGALQRIDELLGFDWLAWYGVVAAHPLLQTAGRLAYGSIYLTPALILGHFAWIDARAEARAFLASFWLAALVSLIVYPMMPAIGPFATLWRGPIPYMPASALWQPEMIPALRLHLIRHIDIGELRGLVSAPSFHTAAAILYIAAAWPYRRLRWPVLAINAAMLLATPVEGTHYLTDMIAGAAVAGIALAAVAQLNRALRSSPMRYARTASA